MAHPDLPASFGSPKRPRYSAQEGLSSKVTIPQSFAVLGIFTHQERAHKVHDSFTPQPTNNASVYILRNILHDWSRSHSIRIMKHLSHAAKNYLSQIAGAQCRLVILEAIVPSPSPSLPFEEVLIPDDVPKELLPSLGGVVARYDLWVSTPHSIPLNF